MVLSKAAFIFESFFERSMKFVVFLQQTIRLREKALMVAPQSWRQGSKAALSKIQAKNVIFRTKTWTDFQGKYRIKEDFGNNKAVTLLAPHILNLQIHEILHDRNALFAKKP